MKIDRLVRIFIIFLGLALAACSDDSAGLERILELQAEAAGSLPEGTMMRVEATRYEPGWGAPVLLIFEAMKPGMVRVTVDFGDGLYQEGYDGSGAWERAGLSSRASGAEDLTEAALRHAAEWLGGARSLLELREERGASIEMISEDEIFPAEKGLIGLRVTLADDFQEDVFLDPESYLMVKKRTTKSLDVWLATEAIESIYSEFQQQGPLMVAMVTEERRSTDDAVVQRITIDRVSYTPNADARHFAMPE